MSAISAGDHEDMELGAAWRRATDALPEGWRLWGICRTAHRLGPWNATAVDTEEGDWEGYGLTPIAALDALTAALRERST